MAERHPVYQCPSCGGAFTVVQGKLIPVASRNGEYTEQRADGVLVETHKTAPNRSSGLVVETAVNMPAPQNIRRGQKRGPMQPLGPMAGVMRPKKSNPFPVGPNFESTGESPDQDFIPEYQDMTPQERHMDQMIQTQYEQDLSQRGFNSTVL